MSNLPPPSQNVFWRDYKIETPTFELTPVEKPDMSPFLVHMTGKKEILDILVGENGPQKNLESHGFLRASEPEYSSGIYDAPIVCFTESPTFALDFFRYRSFRRWRDDQRFGIGFQKSSMVRLGARPVIYVDDSSTSNIISLHKSFSASALTTAREKMCKSVIDGIFPLLFPMRETASTQGFMWEREWRYTNSAGLVFDHADIRIICCPEPEESSIREILGQHSQNIQFVRTWREYSDVTNYLRRQQPIWRADRGGVSVALDIPRRIAAVRSQIQHMQISLHSLDSYEALVERLNIEHERMVKERESIKGQMAAAEAELLELGVEKQTGSIEAMKGADDLGLRK
jgi:hypothetical protein